MRPSWLQKCPVAFLLCTFCCGIDHATVRVDSCPPPSATARATPPCSISCSKRKPSTDSFVWKRSCLDFRDVKSSGNDTRLCAKVSQQPSAWRSASGAFCPVHDFLPAMRSAPTREWTLGRQFLGLTTAS